MYIIYRTISNDVFKRLSFLLWLSFYKDKKNRKKACINYIISFRRGIISEFCSDFRLFYSLFFPFGLILTYDFCCPYSLGPMTAFVMKSPLVIYVFSDIRFWITHGEIKKTYKHIKACWIHIQRSPPIVDSKGTKNAVY